MLGSVVRCLVVVMELVKIVSFSFVGIWLMRERVIGFLFMSSIMLLWSRVVVFWVISVVFGLGVLFWWWIVFGVLGLASVLLCIFFIKLFFVSLWRLCCIVFFEIFRCLFSFVDLILFCRLMIFRIMFCCFFFSIVFVVVVGFVWLVGLLVSMD